MWVRTAVCASPATKRNPADAVVHVTPRATERRSEECSGCIVVPAECRQVAAVYRSGPVLRRVLDGRLTHDISEVVGTVVGQLRPPGDVANPLRWLRSERSGKIGWVFDQPDEARFGKAACKKQLVVVDDLAELW